MRQLQILHDQKSESGATMIGLALILACVTLMAIPALGGVNKGIRKTLCYPASALVNDANEFRKILDQTKGHPFVMEANEGKGKCYFRSPNKFGKRYIVM
jgi:Flp pilus assembly pilin Flp